MEEVRFNVIIIGGGLSGLAAAYTLAEAGQEVLLLEKGDYCGAKNVTGGRMYVSLIRDFFPAIWAKAPLERAIVQEELCLMSPGSSILIRYNDADIASEPYQSYSVCRAKFDKYFAKQAEKKGALITVKKKVDSLVFKDGKVDGVVAGGETLYADVVICCDGALSLFAQQAYLQKPLNPKHFAVGFKEIIELAPETLENRFNLLPGQGAARLYMGDVTEGKFGGGFLYTNKESVSLGLVLGLEALCQEEPRTKAPDLLERFKKRPEVAALIAGGQTAEYSAHVIPEGGYDHLSKLFGDGILVAGDAAGFSINAGITVRGMEYAMFSGYIAAWAAIKAAGTGDYSAESLSVYERMLADSFLMQDFKEYRHVTESLNHKRFFTYYPELAGKIMHGLYAMPNGPKARITPTLRRSVGVRNVPDMLLKDLPKVVKL
ncbi:MAG: FAD-dependent oxidoreductase [Gracilibacteraceae bacterium]|jgi:electron transfer flavoprotein-quinone oxidoreductase|nr:FAD-dependent oxidoreductase [Gracilibacteraceae bacterium]